MFIWKLMLEGRLFNADGGAGAGAGGGDGGGDKGAGAGAGDKGAGAGAGDKGSAGDDGKGGGDKGLRGLIDKGAGGGDGDKGGGDKGAGPQPYYPEGIPDSFKGKTDKETIDALAKGIRQAPAKPEDYKPEFAPEVAKAFPNLDKDPAYLVAAKIAHKHGLDNAQLSGMIGELYAELAKEGILEPAIDMEAEVAKLEPKEGNPARRQAAAAQRMNAAEAWIKGMVTNKHLSQDEAAVLAAGMTIAAGTTLVEKFIAMASKGGITIENSNPLNGGGRAQTEHEKALAAFYPKSNHKV